MTIVEKCGKNEFMNSQLFTVFIQESTRFLSQYLRSRPQKRPAILDEPIEEEEPLELIREPLEVIESEPAAQPENKATSIEAGCIPCSLGHISTCSGLLSESMRFARKDGINSNEVVDRVGLCIDEISALERVDLRPQLIVNLPPWEKELARKILLESRNIRHGLEKISTVEDLEKIAAQAQIVRQEIGRTWFNHRLSQEKLEENVSDEQ